MWTEEDRPVVTVAGRQALESRRKPEAPQEKPTLPIACSFLPIAQAVST